MHEHVEQLLFQQLSLVEGGYNAITIETTVHLTGNDDHVQFGYELIDTATRETVGITVWTEPIPLSDPREVAEVLAQIVLRARAKLTPF